MFGCGCRCDRQTVVIHNNYSSEKSKDLSRVNKKLNKVLRAQRQLELQLMSTRDELEARLDETKKDLVRLLADVAKVKDDLAEALRNSDLTAATAKVEELDALIEAVSPEPVVEEPPVEEPPVEEPVEETPAEETPSEENPS